MAHIKTRYRCTRTTFVLFVSLVVRSASLWADSTVVFNEIMYHHPESADLEWVELHNQMAVDMDISNWSLSAGVQFTFPEGTIVPGRGFLVVVASPTPLDEGTQLAGALGPFVGTLDNGGETLELRNNSFRLMDRVQYRDRGRWPVAGGAGWVRSDTR